MWTSQKHNTNKPTANRALVKVVNRSFKEQDILTDDIFFSYWQKQEFAFYGKFKEEKWHWFCRNTENENESYYNILQKKKQKRIWNR